MPFGEHMWTMVGFSFYMYEGIGGLMPLMAATKDKQAFPSLVMFVFAVLAAMHITFSLLCYYTFGSGLDKPIITEMLPQDNIIV